MSLNAAALKLMADKGLSLHDAAEIAAAIEADAPRVDRAADKRRAWDRERKREQRLSGGMSTGNPPDPAPNERDNLTPTRVEKPKPNGLVKKVEKGFRLPADWQPEPLTGKAAAMVALWQPGALERELAKFKNYWLSKGANSARTDWQRTWVNWLITADEKQPRQTHGRSFEQLLAERFGSDDAGDDAAPDRTRIDEPGGSSAMGAGRC